MLPGLIYIGALAIWHLMGITPLASWWPYKLASLFDIWLYAPLPFLALYAVFRRRWLGVALLCLPLLTLAYEYPDLFLPTPPAGPGVPLRVMTANLLATNDEAEALGAAVAEQHPDLLAVQELTPTLARALKRQIGVEYPYAVLHPSEDWPTLGVYSRFPLRGVSVGGPGADACPCQQVTVDVEGQVITVLNVHPSRPEIAFRRIGPLPVPTRFDTSRNDRAVQAILDRVETINSPLIVVGDFNVSDRDPSYLLLGQTLNDAYRSAGLGLGYTFPSRHFGELPLVRKVVSLPYFPVLRIDYVFHSDEWAAATAQLVEVPGSDHLSIVADLRLKQDVPQSAGR